MIETFLNCVIMDNGEVLFCGRSLGFLTSDKREKYCYYAIYKTVKGVLVDTI